MSVLPPAAANIFDLFKGFTLQALRDPKPISAPSYQVFEYSPHNGAFVVWFHVQTHDFPHIIGYLPAAACTVPEEVEAFRIAVRAHEDLFEVSKTNVRAELLRTLYAVFDGEAEGVLECRVPVSKNGPCLEGESVEGSEETLDDIPVSWRALALDILSGRPQHKGSQAEVPIDSYEVWAYRADSASVVILRYFEGGKAWAVAACRPGIDYESPEFDVALDELYKIRLGGISSPTQMAQIEAGFENLRPAQAMAMLGKAIGTYADSGGIVYEPGIFGRATLETLNRIKLISSMEGMGGASERTSHFEMMATVLIDSLDPEDQVRWSAEREAQGLERVEVLKHRSYPGVLLVHFDPEQGLILSTCLPHEVDAARHTHQAFELAVHNLVRNRKLLSESPQPMPDISPFVRIKDAAIEQTLEESLALLSEGKAQTKTYGAQDFKDAENAAQSAIRGTAVIERPQGTRLH